MSALAPPSLATGVDVERARARPDSMSRTLVELDALLAQLFEAFGDVLVLWPDGSLREVRPLTERHATRIADELRALDAGAPAARALAWRARSDLEPAFRESLAEDSRRGNRSNARVPYADAYLSYLARTLPDTEYWRTVLRDAARVNAVQLFVEARRIEGVDDAVDMRDTLEVAALAGAADMVRYLLAAPGLLTAAQVSARSNILVAETAESGHVDVLRVLAEARRAGVPAAAAVRFDDNDNEPIRSAAGGKSTPAVRWLLEARASGVPGAEGVDAAAGANQVMHYVLEQSDTVLLRYLLKARDANAPGATGVVVRPTPRRVARFTGPMVRAMLRAPLRANEIPDYAAENNYALKTGAREGDLSLVRSLMEARAAGAAGAAGVNAFARSDTSESALQIAAEKGQLEVVRYLLEARAANAAGTEGESTVASETALVVSAASASRWGPKSKPLETLVYLLAQHLAGAPGIAQADLMAVLNELTPGPGRSYYYARQEQMAALREAIAEKRTRDARAIKQEPAAPGAEGEAAKRARTSAHAELAALAAAMPSTAARTLAPLTPEAVAHIEARRSFRRYRTLAELEAALTAALAAGGALERRRPALEAYLAHWLRHAHASAAYWRALLVRAASAGSAQLVAEARAVLEEDADEDEDEENAAALRRALEAARAAARAARQDEVLKMLAS